MARDVNQCLIVVGDFGKYQWVQLLFTGLLMAILGQHMLIAVFTHGEPAFKCLSGADMNSTIPYGQGTIFNSTCSPCAEDCKNITVLHTENECYGYLYDQTVFPVGTVITEFDLVCSKATIITVSQTLYMVALGTGGILGGYIADRFGRKRMAIAGALILALSGVGSAFSVNVVMYTVFRCLGGLITNCTYEVLLALVTESASPLKRSQLANAQAFFWALGPAALSLVCWLLPYWRHSLAAISVAPLILGLAFVWVLDDTPHWLIMQGRAVDAGKVLMKMAQWNRVHFKLEVSDLVNVKAHEHTQTLEKKSWRILLTRKRLIARTAVFSLGWLTGAATYFALAFAVGSLAGNLYVNNFISCIVEAIAFGFCFLIACLGRKGPTIFCYIASSVSLLVSSLLVAYHPDAGTAISAVSLLGKLFVSAAWQIVMVWSGEMYPTTYRCTLVSVNSLGGQIGGILAPFLLDMHKILDVNHGKVVAPSVCSALMLISGILHIIPPETNRCSLPETVDEANAVCFEKVKDDKQDIGSKDEEIRLTFSHHEST